MIIQVKCQFEVSVSLGLRVQIRSRQFLQVVLDKKIQVLIYEKLCKISSIDLLE